MLQRIQSIYLALAILISGLFSFWFPFWTDQNQKQLSLVSMFQSEDILIMIIPIVFIISALISALTLFSYKNRKKQIIYNRLNIVLNFLLLGIIVYHLLMLPGEAVASEKGIGSFIPIVVIVLLAMANKGIIKDEKLVKSVDRLR